MKQAFAPEANSAAVAVFVTPARLPSNATKLVSNWAATAETVAAA
jgi:hypothetical protein